MPKGDRLKLKADPEDGTTPIKLSNNDKGRISFRYNKWRNEVSGGSCALCGRVSDSTQGIRLEVHHIWAMAKYPELAFDSNNGITLCRNCHKQIHAQMRVNAITEQDVYNIKVAHSLLVERVFKEQLKKLVEEW